VIKLPPDMSLVNIVVDTFVRRVGCFNGLWLLTNEE